MLRPSPNHRTQRLPNDDDDDDDDDDDIVQNVLLLVDGRVPRKTNFNPPGSTTVGDTYTFTPSRIEPIEESYNNNKRPNRRIFTKCA